MTKPQRHKATARQVQALVRQAQDLLLDAANGDPCRALDILSTIQTRPTSVAGHLRRASAATPATTRNRRSHRRAR